MKNKTWLIIAIAILIVVIFVIVRNSGEPTEVPVTTTTTEEIIIEDVLPVEPVDGGVIDTEGEVLNSESGVGL